MKKDHLNSKNCDSRSRMLLVIFSKSFDCSLQLQLFDPKIDSCAIVLATHTLFVLHPPSIKPFLILDKDADTPFFGLD